MRRPGKMFREVLRSMFRKAATVRYPFVKVMMPDKFRGKLSFEAAKCIGCKLCMKDCPSGAITIHKVGDKKFEAEFDFSRCIYCAQCVDSCPRKALAATGEFELAQINRSKLTVTFRAECPAVAAAAPSAVDTATAVAEPPAQDEKA
jgi:formate hydrogenlyase subunit 6/NADH:ubiquinone oxidoreductase subunit I